MSGQIGNRSRNAIASVVTALSCAASLLSTLDRPPGHEPLPGTRTAIELIAGGSHRGLLKVAPFRVMS